jgi:Tfp pilus assembly protein PilN
MRLRVSRRLIVASLVVALVAAMFVWVRVMIVRQQAYSAAAALAAERRRAAELSSITAERAQTQARLRHAQDVVASVDKLRVRQRDPSVFVENVDACLPSGVGLQRLDLAGTSVVIVGDAEDAEDADRFTLNLQADRDAFADVAPATRETVESQDAGVRQRFTVRATFVPRRAPTPATR